MLNSMMSTHEVLVDEPAPEAGSPDARTDEHLMIAESELGPGRELPAHEERDPVAPDFAPIGDPVTRTDDPDGRLRADERLPDAPAMG